MDVKSLLSYTISMTQQSTVTAQPSKWTFPFSTGTQWKLKRNCLFYIAFDTLPFVLHTKRHQFTFCLWYIILVMRINMVFESFVYSFFFLKSTTAEADGNHQSIQRSRNLPRFFESAWRGICPRQRCLLQHFSAHVCKGRVSEQNQVATSSGIRKSQLWRSWHSSGKHSSAKRLRVLCEFASKNLQHGAQEGAIFLVIF